MHTYAECFIRGVQAYYHARIAVKTPDEQLKNALQDLAILIGELEAPTRSAAFATAGDARAQRWVPVPPWQTGLTNGMTGMSTSGPALPSTGAATAPEPMPTVYEDMDIS